jgi:hypothetical protein
MIYTLLLECRLQCLGCYASLADKDATWQGWERYDGEWNHGVMQVRTHSLTV